VRPYALSFLSEMSEMFEIIVFTAGTKNYADWILNQIDSSRHVSHWLYRHHTMPEGEVYIKDLDLLNWDLKSTVIVDNLWENYMYHKENGVEIASWYDDYSDRCLYHLGEILWEIYNHWRWNPENFDIWNELTHRHSLIKDLVSWRDEPTFN